MVKESSRSEEEKLDKSSSVCVLLRYEQEKVRRETMERLTKCGERKGRGRYVSAIGSGRGTWGKIIDKLARYENTGLEPEQIPYIFFEVVKKVDGVWVLQTEKLVALFGCSPGIHHVKQCDDMGCKECWELWLEEIACKREEG